jgi:hypothetical protein
MRARGRAKPVHTHPRSRTRFAIRSKPDQPGAEQRRGMPIVVALRKGHAECSVGDRTVRVAAIHLVPGETSAIAFIDVFL